jgi:HlyD family secretion protein
MRTRRLVIIIILITLAAIVCVGGGQLAANLVEKSQPPPSTPEAVSAKARLRAQGEVVPGRWVELGFAGGGVLAEMPVTMGQEVKAGDVLARLDTTRLELAVRAATDAIAAQEAALARLQEAPDPTTISAAEAELEAAQAGLADLKAGPSETDVVAANAEVISAQAELARLRALPDPTSVAQAQAQLDKATVALQQAQAAYDQIKQRPEAGLSSQALALQQATIDHNLAKSAFDLAQRTATAAEMQAAQARLASAQAALARIQQGPSETDLATARSRIRSAEASLAQAQKTASEADLTAAKANLSQAQTQLAQAQVDLEAATLRAPFAGTITAISADAGEVVSNAPFITLADLTNWQVETVDVDEWVAARLEPGQAAELTFPAFEGKALAGVVVSIAPRAERADGSDPFYTVVVALDEPEAGQYPELVERLRWGMTVRLDFGEEE